MNASAPTVNDPPLIRRLLEMRDVRRLDEETLDSFIAQAGEGVLFFTEDPVRVKEVNDLAVILPEIRAATRAFRIGVLPPALANARASRWAVRRWPALVFVREGAWLGNIEGLRDWADYVALANERLSAEPQPMPARVIAVASATACTGAGP